MKLGPGLAYSKPYTYAKEIHPKANMNVNLIKIGYQSF